MGVNKRIWTAGHMGGGSRFGGGNLDIIRVRNRTFLDRPTVIEALEFKYRRVMAKLGGYVRTTMQRSMRRRKRTSKPGEPPTSRQGALRSLIEFGYDANDHSLVVGPQLIKSSTLPLGGKSVPQLLNEGGGAMIYDRRTKQRVVGHYAPRPFVQPAVSKGIDKLKTLLETVPLIQTKGR